MQWLVSISVGGDEAVLRVWEARTVSSSDLSSAYMRKHGFAPSHPLARGMTRLLGMVRWFGPVPDDGIAGGHMTYRYPHLKRLRVKDMIRLIFCRLVVQRRKELFREL